MTEVKKKRKQKPAINYDQKQFIKLMMKHGHYCMRRPNANGTQMMAVYYDKQMLANVFTLATINKFKDLLKKDRAGRMTLNLSAVRQLHGKSWVKKYYKSLKTKKDEVRKMELHRGHPIYCSPCEAFTREGNANALAKRFCR